MCGAVHTGIARSIKNDLGIDLENVDPNTKIVCVGEKSRAILSRLYPKNIILVANEIGRLPPTFWDASKLTNAILRAGYEFNNGKIIYNKFRSVVSYELNDIPIFSQDVVAVSCFPSFWLIQNFIYFL